MPIILPAIALGIALASYALALVQPIGLAQFFGAVMVGLVFVVLAFGLKKIISAFKGIDPATAVVVSFMIPILFTAMSVAIWASSNVLSMVSPISFMQFLVSLAISVVFIVISYAMVPILMAIDKMKWADVPKIPVFLTLISLAIMISSHILAMTADIGFVQLLKIVLFSIVLAIAVIVIGVAMFALSKLNVSVKDAIMGALLIVIISVAIMVSSHILALGNYDTYPDWKWALGVGLSLLAFTPAIVALGFISITGIGALAILAGSGMVLLVSAAIVASSHILAAGNYDKYPSVLWSLGVAAAMIPFTMGILTLGFVAITGLGIGYIAFLAGMSMVVDVAKTIVEVADILAGGKYDNPGMLDWAIATTLLYAAFTPILLILGAVGLASAVISFFGPNPWEMAREMIVQIAETIVDVSFVLQKGVYTGGPTKEWAEGIAIALGAFSPVYEMLMRNSILELFGGGGVGPEEFTEAILTVSDGIITAANKFAILDGLDIWKGGPSKEWAEGVGLAIGAFAPVFAVLAENSGWFSDGSVSVEAMKGAILTISQGIIDAAYFFADNKAPFDEGNYPSEKWGKGVGAALGAFAPVFDALSKNQSSWFTSDDEVIDGMTNGIKRISGSLVDAARAFSGTTYDWKTGKWTKGEDISSMWGTYPSETWAMGVGKSISSFLDIFDTLEDRGYTTVQFAILSDVLNHGITSMASVAKKLFLSKEFFTVAIDPNFIPNIAPNILGFVELGLTLDKMLVSEKTISTESGGILGSGIGSYTKEETIQVTKDMSIVHKVTASLIKMAKMLFNNKEVFSTSIDPNFVKNIGSNIIDFTNLVNHLVMSESGKGILGKITDSIFGNDPITQIAKKMITLADGYDKLASSLVRLSSSMKSLNVTDMKSLGGLTKELVDIKSIDSTNNNISGPVNKDMPMVFGGGLSTKLSAKPDQIMMLDKIDKIVELLTNIDNTSKSINDFMIGAEEEKSVFNPFKLFGT